jgi:hypothetical protein
LLPRNLSISFLVIPGVSVVAVMIFIILYRNSNRKEFRIQVNNVSPYELFSKLS